MTGKLIGVGVGPGDPELLTLKAVRMIQENEVIAVPGEEAKKSVAYEIAVRAVPALAEKHLVAVPMPMIRDEKELEKSHDKAADFIEEILRQGKNVVFLMLGDPTVYSTYLYLHKRIKERGLETEIVNGIPSFCAAAACADMGLVEGNEELHVIPAVYDTEKGMNYSGTRVFMKSGRKIGLVKKRLMQEDCEVFMVENCGMDSQRVVRSAAEIPENAGYYSLIIAKEHSGK